MAHPPFNIFTQHRNPDGALKKLKKLLPNAEVTNRPDGQWAEITGTWKRGWLKSSLVITVKHNPDYYVGDGWRTQLAGMANFFHRFPRSEERQDLFGYIPGLSFVLSFILSPDPVDDDPRQEVIFEMTRFLDGVIFLPSCLLDQAGRAIVAADGDINLDAELPDHTPATPSKPTVTDDGAETEVAGEPPEMLRVVDRLVLMIALVERGFLEEEPGSDTEAYRVEMLQDLKEAGMLREAEDWEVAALEMPIGKLDEKLQWKLPWLSEGAAVLAWGLQQLELPAYDEQVSVDALYQLREKLSSAEAHRGLRSIDEIEKLSLQMLAIHWRLRQFQIDGKRMNFVEYAPKSWFGPMDLGLARIIDNDLEVGGRPLKDAPEKDWKCANGIMQERRQAIHWLLGHDAVYSQNDTST